jgi:hypothetical protein
VDEVEGEVDEEQAMNVIDRLIEFNATYKRKPKKQRKCSETNVQDLLTPARYQSKCLNENEESDPSSLQPSSETSNYEGSNEDGLPLQAQSRRTRRCSEESSTNLLLPDRIRTRAHSQGTQPAAIAT